MTEEEWWTINLPPRSRWMKKELQKLKAETGKYQYEFVEEALSQYLREKKKEKERHNDLPLTKKEAKEVIKIIITVQNIIEQLEEQESKWNEPPPREWEYEAIPLDFWEEEMGMKFPLLFPMHFLNKAIEKVVEKEEGDITPYYLREKKKLFFTRLIIEEGKTIGLIREKEKSESYGDFMTGKGLDSQKRLKVKLNVSVVRRILYDFKLESL